MVDGGELATRRGAAAPCMQMVLQLNDAESEPEGVLESRPENSTPLGDGGFGLRPVADTPEPGQNPVWGVCGRTEEARIMGT